MKSAGIYLLLGTTAILSVAVQSTKGGTCNACNCQFNNVQVLTELIREEIASVVTNSSASDAGVTYTRWGKSSCPSTEGTQLLYAGRAGGTHYNQRGGGAEKLCLPADPDYLPSTAGFTGFANVIHGAEYEFDLGPTGNLHQSNVPCAVCYVPIRAVTITVPAKSECPPAWTREYYGYLTTERDANYRSSYNCMDVNADAIAGSGSNTDGALFYYTYTNCNGLACPPYESRRILSCVVCTK